MPEKPYEWGGPEDFKAKETDILIALFGGKAATELFLERIGAGAGPSNIDLTLPLTPQRLRGQSGTIGDRVVLVVLQPSDETVVIGIDALMRWMKKTYHDGLRVNTKLSGFVWLIDAATESKPSEILDSELAFGALKQLCYDGQRTMETTIHPVMLTFNPNHGQHAFSKDLLNANKTAILDVWKRLGAYTVTNWCKESAGTPKEVFNDAILHRTKRTMEKLDVKNDEYHPDDIIIAIMGATGTGKTNLITWFGNAFCPDSIGGNVIPSGHSRLDSGTKDLVPYRILNHPIHHNKIVLLDTPGFNDDKDHSDRETLEKIANWLLKTYTFNGKTLTCILYLNSIKVNRVTGSALRSLRMFGQLCGNHAAANVVFITTMWDLQSNKEEGERRMSEYIDKYWKGLIVGGASYTKFDNSVSSVTAIFNLVFNSERRQKITRLLDELARVKKDINETDAAKVVRAGLQAQVAELEQIQKDVLKELEKKQAKLQEDLNKIQQDVDSKPSPENQLQIESLQHLQQQYDDVEATIRNRTHDVNLLKPPAGGNLHPRAWAKLYRQLRPGSPRGVELGGSN